MTITIENPIKKVNALLTKKNAKDMLRKELKDAYYQRGLAKVALARTRCTSAQAAAELRMIVSYIEVAEAALNRLEGKN